MDISKYTTEQIEKELAQARRNLAEWQDADKRQKRVKQEILWNKAIIARDEAELTRRKAEQNS